jgi:hypothetical protein
MALASCGGEGIHSGDGGVIAEDAADGVQEDGFAIAAGSEDEEQGVFANVAGEAIAAPLAEEAYQVNVTACRIIEELEPQRAVCFFGRRDAGQLRDEIALRRRAQKAGAQIDRAAGCAEQPRVAVPDFGCDGEDAVCLGVAFDCACG